MQHATLKATFSLASVLLVSVLLAPAHAVVIRNGCAGGEFGDLCSLAELVNNNGSIQIDDKIFDGWQVIPGTAPAGVKLTERGEGTNLHGFSFDVMTSPSPFSATPGETFLTNISFLVSTVSGRATIKDNDLSLTASGRGKNINDALITITETLSNGVRKQVTTPGNKFQRRDFEPVSSLGVVTTIEIFGGTGGTGNELTFVRSYTQRFSQVPVPEPASLLLLGGGIGLYALFKCHGSHRRKVHDALPSVAHSSNR